MVANLKHTEDASSKSDSSTDNDAELQAWGTIASIVSKDVVVSNCDNSTGEDDVLLPPLLSLQAAVAVARESKEAHGTTSGKVTERTSSAC